MHKTNYKRVCGFALLEVMIATIILCGIIYMFISFSQTQQKQINNQNVGKHLAIPVNQILMSVSKNGTCPSGASGGGSVNFATCAQMSDANKTSLANDGIDLTSSTVTITPG